MCIYKKERAGRRRIRATPAVNVLPTWAKAAQPTAARAREKIRDMPRRILACLLALASFAWGQSQPMTVQQLLTFVRNQQKLIQENKGADRELADFLGKVRLTEKLEASVIEDLQAGGLGALTLKALQKLQEQSRGLKAAIIRQVLPDEPMPPPTSEEQGRILDDVRRYVFNYDDSLPDFICMEVEQRMVAPRLGGQLNGRPGGQPSYRTADTITSKLTYFQHKEEKTPILNGSRPVTGNYESLGGATSHGDFETALRLLFDPATEARFEWARWVTLRGRLTMVFSYRVSLARSQYRIGVSDHKVERITAYSGEVYVDAEAPHPVTRMKTKADDIPVDFPLRKVETMLDYAYTDIGGQSFLLPYNEEVQMDSGEGFAKNSNSFLHYRKYEVGSAISYDIPADGPVVPDASLKETAPPKPGAPAGKQ
jgi:hypothetical protein